MEEHSHRGEMEVVATTHINNDEAEIERLVRRSLKRTYDFFLPNHGTRAPENIPSASLRLAVKLKDEYEPVRNMEPAPKRTAITPSAPSPATTKSPSIAKPIGPPSMDQVEVRGPHAVPSGPGVTLTESAVGSVEEVSHEHLTELMKHVPNKQEEEARVRAGSIVEYRGAAGGGGRAISDRFRAPSAGAASYALAKKGLQLEKPQWHAPWKLMRVISGHLGWVRTVAVEPGNEWFATGAADRTIKLWDMASGTLKLTLVGHINCPRGLAVSVRHPYLFSCAEDKMVKCWDLEYNKAIRSYHGHLSGVYCLALHPTIDVLVTGGRDSTARVWDIRTKAQVHCLASHNNTVVSLVTQATDPQIISGSMDTTMKMWDLKTGKCMSTLTNHKKGIRAMVMHPVEHTFASGSADNIKKWKLPQGEFFQNLSGHNTILHTLALNDDDVLVSGGDNGSLFFWDWKTGYNFQKLQTTVQPGSLDCEAAIYASTFDKTGTRFITCEADKTIKIWKEDEEATEETHPVEWKPSFAAKRW